MILLNYNEIEKNIKKIMKNSKNIRKKIKEVNPITPTIETVWGIGFKIC